VQFGDLDAHVTGGTDGRGGGDGPVVILLHGFGAPGDDLVPLGRVLAPRVPAGTRFVFPAAPIDLGRAYAGGRAWWAVDMVERMRRQALGEQRDITEVPVGLDGARAAVSALIADVDRQLRPPPGKTVLGGFSQGAMVSLDLALRSTHPFAGLLLLSGTHLAANEWAAAFEARRGLPVFMSHGEQDEMLPFGVSQRLGETLSSHGFDVTWVPFRGGHGIPPVALDRGGAFLSRVLG
jgi:phospholipase/carboxylesterase